MNILSLFDGMSCGRIALERAGVKVDNYYASEIDKYATKVSEANYPDIIRLGDVTKWKEWDIDWSSIDLIIAGSPCQGFSFAGKQLAFNDPRSKLFFVFVDILTHIREFNPNIKFLLENVRMKKEYLDTISDFLGVQPVCINSALVSAQNRVRYYWTNICEIQQPEDKGILLKDILEDESNVTKDNLVLRPAEPRECKKDSLCKHVANAIDIKGHDSIKRVYSRLGKSPALTTMQGGHREPKVLCNESATKNGKAYALTASYNGAVAWNSCERKQKTMVPVEKSENKDPNVYNGVRYRKLTPEECEALQTVPRGYSSCVSKTQRLKMLGNGWTIDVFVPIFKELN